MCLIAANCWPFSIFPGGFLRRSPMFGVVKLLLLAIAEGVALEDVVGLQTSGSHGTKESDAKLQKVVKQTDRGAAKNKRSTALY